MNLMERFERHYVPEPNSGCWLWTGAIVAKLGYGCLRIDGKTMLAHRFAFAAFGRGDALPGMDICHSCDVPCCVNPDHLFIGTRSDNVRDCVAKGRHKANPENIKKAQAFQIAKTHCPQGHPYDEVNTYIYKKKNGSQARYCRQCVHAAKLRYRGKQ